jgi:hypothetical protein
MREKEIRDRIEQFLKRTARNVVVPASMGLGLSIAGCDQHSLTTKHAPDAASDVVAQKQDVAGPDASNPDAANDLPSMVLPYLVYAGPDAAHDESKADLPRILVPYLIYAPDTGSEATPPIDSGTEGGPGDAPPDLSMPPPPYMVPFPEPPYLVLHLPAPDPKNKG